MHRIFLWMLALSALSIHVLPGRDLTGQWQGTLPVPGGRRLILKVAQAADGKLSATFFDIDESPEGQPVKSVSLEGSTFRFDFDLAADRYEGTVSDDGTAISGRWYGSRHPGTFYPFDLHLVTGAAAWPTDSSAHTVQFVRVEDGVKLEVLDWGGTGRPLVFLAGLGNDAHVFDTFAPKFTPDHHVYGITRRGFGASSAPDPANGNYSADRLGDDVLAVIDSLKIERPVLVGHSIAGEELSSIGSRHPEKVAGLIYLDAGYSYAYYDRTQGDLTLDAQEVQRKLSQLTSIRASLRENQARLHELLDTDLPQLTKSLERRRKELDAKTNPALAQKPPGDVPMARIVQAIYAGEQKYTDIRCPVLALFAVPPKPEPAAKDDPSAYTEDDLAAGAAQVKAFETGVPSARVVRLQNANHYVFKSNEAEVRREMNDFISKLP